MNEVGSTVEDGAAAPGTVEVADGAEIVAHEPTEITYDEQRYAPVPAPCAAHARRRGCAAPTPRRGPRPVRAPPTAATPSTCGGCCCSRCSPTRRRSAGSSPASPACGRTPTPSPTPTGRGHAAAVWFTAYPISLVTARAGRSSAPSATRAVAGVPAASGSTPCTPGPVKSAGGLDGWRQTPSVDGHFDRISTEIDPMFGTEDEFRHLCEVADRPRRQRHRRHRPRPHRQGRGLPPRRDGLPGLPRHLPHGRDPAGGLEPAARGARPATTPRTSTPRPRPRSPSTGTSSASSSGSSSTRPASRRRTGPRPARSWASTG